MPSNRTDIFRIAIDAAGSADQVLLGSGGLASAVGPYSRITATIENTLLSWNLYSPLSSSPKKSFGAGEPKIYDAGPYSSGDSLGFFELTAGEGSDFLILVCDR